MCPDSSGKFKGIAISRVPWHTNQEHDSLPNLSSQWFCNGDTCKSCDCPKSLCDESKCEKPCRKCDRDGMKQDGW